MIAACTSSSVIERRRRQSVLGSVVEMVPEVSSLIRFGPPCRYDVARIGKPLSSFPRKAGIQRAEEALAALDPRFRGGDDTFDEMGPSLSDPQGASFDMMIVPEAANMPPTPWQTEILAPGIWAGAVPRIWRTLSCNAYMPYMPECMYERPPPLVLSGSLPVPGAVLRSQIKLAASPFWQKPRSSSP